MTPEEHRAFWRNVQFTVDKDVVRTDRSNQFFRGEDNPNVESMRYPPPCQHNCFSPCSCHSGGHLVPRAAGGPLESGRAGACAGRVSGVLQVHAINTWEQGIVSYFRQRWSAP